jgi:predicted MPP superfamily phosphohydrolase
MQIQSKVSIALEKSFKRRVATRHKRNALHPLLILSSVAFGRLPKIMSRTSEEARTLSVTRTVIKLPQLPSSFEGMTFAFLTDLHCSPLTPPTFLETVIDETLRLKPDLVLLGGDYITHGTMYLRPVGDLLSRLKSPLGVYSVLGNHDHWVDVRAVRAALAQAGIVDLTNSGAWLRHDGSRIRIAGVGDLWEDRQDLHAALDGTKENEVAILLSHNPDFAAGLKDKRVKLVLSGHTHGGQIRLPGVGPLVTNSMYGRRLASGLISFDSFQLYVSRGLGTVIVPIRYNCPPELSLMTVTSQ